jgi:hypothetical protein
VIDIQGAAANGDTNSAVTVMVQNVAAWIHPQLMFNMEQCKAYMNSK